MNRLLNAIQRLSKNVFFAKSCRQWVAYPAALFVSLASVSVSAHEQGHAGVYIGGAYLGSEYNDDNELSLYGLSLDDEDDGYAAWVGYRFTDFFSVELAHADLGQFQFFDNSPASTLDYVDRCIDSTTANVIGTWPLAGSSLELFGKLGLGSARFIERFNEQEVKSRGGTQLLGIGMAYSPPEGEAISLIIGVDVHSFAVDAGPFDDDDFYQSVVATYAGLRLNF